MYESNEQAATPPQIENEKSQSMLSKASEDAIQNDDVKQEDVYNFIKKAAALKNESSSTISKGVSEFSKAIADVYAMSKNNLLDESTEYIKAATLAPKVTESYEKLEKPLYYNFGLQKPVIGPFLNATPMVQPTLTLPTNKFTSSYSNLPKSILSNAILG